jgi:hypothetical protein
MTTLSPFLRALGGNCPHNKGNNMSKLKLSVDLLDNLHGSAVVNIGRNSGYVEVFIDEAGDLTVIVYDKTGEIVHSYDTPWKK